MASRLPIFLDYHSTTPVDPFVLEAMLPFFTQYFGNPASRSHPYGWQASEAVEIARQKVANLIQANPKEIVFTSGSTEGLNLAIKGLAESLQHKGRHIITLSTEHHAVLDPLDWLAKKNFEVIKLPVQPSGLVDPDVLENSIRKDTIMVIVMWANNESGVIQDIQHIGKICREKGVAFICDATQAGGKIKIDVIENFIDVLALSAHKMYGPKGIGGLYVAQNEKKLKPDPLIHGGGHENGLRSGTLNVPGIVGFGAACEVIMKNMYEDLPRIKSLRDTFERNMLKNLKYIAVNGSVDKRLSTVSNLKVAHVDSQAIMTKLRTKLAISSGSACSSANPSPSHVLMAMGLSAEEAKGSFRISAGRFTTEQEMISASEMLIEEINKHREDSPSWQLFCKEKELS